MKHKINFLFLSVSLAITPLSANADWLDTFTRLLPSTTIKGPDVPTGLYIIQQKANGRFLDAYTDSSKDFSVVTRTAQNTNSQKWYIQYKSKNTYTIQHKSNKRFLDAHVVSQDDFSVVTRPTQSNKTQEWVIKPADNDTYTIQQKSNNRFLDAHVISKDDFSVVTRPEQKNNTQRWKVYRTTAKANVDFTKYCKKNFGSSYRAVLIGKTVNDWVCQDNKGISVKKACLQQYATKEHAFENNNDPDSWYCKVRN